MASGWTVNISLLIGRHTTGPHGFPLNREFPSEDPDLDRSFQLIALIQADYRLHGPFL
jgi:hypothetical protein